MRWLTCTVGSTRIYVRTTDVQMIAEYRCGPPPPLTSSYIAGTAIVEGRLALSIRVGLRRTAADRTTRGVLLVTPDPDLAWAFEVDGTAGFVDDVQPDRLVAEPTWLLRSRSGERFLDVPAMVHALTSPA